MRRAETAVEHQQVVSIDAVMSEMGLGRVKTPTPAARNPTDEPFAMRQLPVVK
jgi:hypothetical protein